jgi:hypothetical protein
MIGYFGDSFIDVASRTEPSWPLMVSDLLNDKGDYYGKSGTSHWYSYELFLKNYKKYDTIIFCHTAHSRWPHLPEHETGHHWKIGYPGVIVNDFMKKINEVYHDIFSDELLTFICGNIYRNVNQICKQNNIYLINILPFEVTYNLDTEFVNIFNINIVSRNEVMEYHGKQFGTSDWLHTYPNVDPRCCHLNDRNNAIFSEILSDLTKNKVMNKNIDALDYQWEYHDRDMDRKFIETK